jgi:hypothetical protein
MSKLFISTVLAMSLAIGGCMPMSAGSQPDYDLIEIGSMASMAVLINETDATDASVLVAHARLIILYESLSCEPSELSCPPFQFFMLETMIGNALPMEYQVLGIAAIRLIKSRSNIYLDDALSDSENIEIIRKVAATVVGGMVQALDPKVLHIQSRG